MRPCLALPFTIVPSPDQVRLLAGEDFRYTLNGPALDTWLPAWLRLIDGRRTVDELLALLPEERRPVARRLVERLYDERVLVEGPASAAFLPCCPGLRIEGDGILVDSLRSLHQHTRPDELALRVFCQDRLDYDAALRFNHRCLDENRSWLWATCGALSRGYVSPLFLPDAGPCLACLFSSFRRLSPAPELYEELLRHAQGGGVIPPSPVSPRLTAVLCQLVLWKAELAQQKEPEAVLFRLHVIEAATMEVSSHRVFVDPACTECRGRR
jgi:bacteriocin biosynthesis cyclodehydratase domain-containing protein